MNKKLEPTQIDLFLLLAGMEKERKKVIFTSSKNQNEIVCLMDICVTM